MKKIFFLFLLTLSLSAGKLDFKELGFSLESFNASPQNDDSYIVVKIFKAENKHGFSANMNVIIHKFGQSMHEYVKISDKRLLGLEKFNNIKSYSDTKMAYWEYTAYMYGLTLHFISKAFLAEDKNTVYLLTAASLEEDWAENEKDFKRIADSFKLY